MNAKDPSQLVAAYQTNATPAYSQDAGSSWKIATGTAPKDYRISGDVSVTYDERGTAILCYIAFDKLGTINYWAHGATRNGIFVRRSLDGGATWEAEAHPVLAQPTKPGIPFEDKPYIAADNTTSKFSGNLYIGWTEFRIDESVILFSRSTDGGQTWSTPIDISKHQGLPRDDNGAVEGFTGAVSADGTLYAAWADGNSIASPRRRTAARPLPRAAASFRPLRFTSTLWAWTGPTAFRNRYRSAPWPQRPALCHLERLSRRRYWRVLRDVGQRRQHLDQGGARELESRARRHRPVLPVAGRDPVTGAANIIFYDRRLDPENKKTTVTLARSTDGGRTFANYAWTRDAFVPSRDDFLGDYIGVAALNNKVYGVWAEIAPPTAPKEEDAPATERRPQTIVQWVSQTSEPRPAPF